MMSEKQFQSWVELTDIWNIERPNL